MARISGTRTASRTTAPKKPDAGKSTPKKPAAKETKNTGWVPRGSAGGSSEAGGGYAKPFPGHYASGGGGGE